ncbi:DUF2065 domain-containing protein [Hansschlegelia quercus]|jgi:uncharacterized protein YjeT (DUF2065 family)|uniref:DUF2065 domain-containing protein n=1 Tax=Hansschlegelia quercus TaxID=2528245 RepID=A0A4Q9GKC5_9HYPH|nr:DUF2065 domain-containing protein [Hansschlegelia quercus]TBN54638.1 DUF2065 domain-containing protein [Hansschlegelia quercus]
MSDFFAALGLVLAIEGLLFAGFPAAAKKASANIVATPDQALRWVGVLSALLGVVIVWVVRG